MSTTLWFARTEANLAQSCRRSRTALVAEDLQRMPRADVSAPDARPEIPKSAITVRWMTHAKFDHQAHQLVTCTECHAQAKTSNKTADVLLPGIATCQKCHNGGTYCGEIRAARSATLITTGRKPKPASSVHAIADFASPLTRWTRRRVRHRIDLPVAQKHPLGFLLVQRPRASAIENRHLVAAFIHGAIAIDAFRNRQRGTRGPIRRDQLGRGPRTESEVVRDCRWARIAARCACRPLRRQDKRTRWRRSCRASRRACR